MSNDDYVGPVTDGVRSLWFTMAGLVSSVVFIGFGFWNAVEHHAFRHDRLSFISPVILGIALGVLGVGSLFAGKFVVKVALNPSTDQSLRASYLSRFFIGVGLGEAPMFIGVVLVAATGHFWLYLVGAATALIELALISPTTTHLDRAQQQINQTGTYRSLRAALASTPQRSRRR